MAGEALMPLALTWRAVLLGGLLSLWAGIVSAQPADYSALVHQALDTFNGSLVSADPHEQECNKARLTFRAGYFIHLKDQNIGLIEKTSGNNCQGYSVDLLYDKSNGWNIDIATDEPCGGMNRCVKVLWFPRHDPAIAHRWRVPSKELAGIDGPVIPPSQPPVQEPPQPPSGGVQIDTERILKEMADMEARLMKRIDEPGWFTRFFGNRYVQMIGAAVGVGLAGLMQGESQ